MVQVSPLALMEENVPSAYVQFVFQESRIIARGERLQHSSRYVERWLHLCRVDAEATVIPRKRRDRSDWTGKAIPYAVYPNTTILIIMALLVLQIFKLLGRPNEQVWPGYSKLPLTKSINAIGPP